MLPLWITSDIVVNFINDKPLDLLEKRQEMGCQLLKSSANLWADGSLS